MLKHFGGEVYRVDDDDAKFDNYIYQHTNNPGLAKERKDVHFRDDKLASIGVPAEQLDAIRHLELPKGSLEDLRRTLLTTDSHLDLGVMPMSTMPIRSLSPG
ncbi:hypothetical protein PC116_g25814 [Phytophthora cactorum]|uniref:Uncharacterized protein n=1 Tax=Phytophthora cactorum TaxID=29920 RepID=A0A329RBU6_9STRA|nr:hypothetical protein Pcac1_g8089 [Phytophthora cactorum]KAG2798816.1 hypothetical protein PC112_g21189 [Phytophthora cactorum]KAG2830292.1 hypothetical protein PC113_g21133 [Phytophthora cactorum]KAG2877320.1 hypothetical protein PC114_g23703 [Phytophthora cactorum]KAG2884484.1 hypothetical protein PC115_g21321 [Phytophthora cactorum]